MPERRIRQVSKTKRPLNTITPIAEIQTPLAALPKNALRIIARNRTNRPTMKKLPHALKSRRLNTAYSDSTAKALNVSNAA